MSKLIKAIKNSNYAEKKEKKRREENLQRLRTETAYSAKLIEELKLIDKILEDSEVIKISLEIPENQISLFSRAIYREEFIGYNIVQISNNMFEISRRLISFN